jgi:hypothetical protein
MIEGRERGRQSGSMCAFFNVWKKETGDGKTENENIKFNFRLLGITEIL